MAIVAMRTGQAVAAPGGASRERSELLLRLAARLGPAERMLVRAVHERGLSIAEVAAQLK